MNISRSGVCFMADAEPDIGGELQLCLDFVGAGYDPTAIANVFCKARVVRTARADRGWVVGAQLLDYNFVSPPAPCTDA